MFYLIIPRKVNKVCYSDLIVVPKFCIAAKCRIGKLGFCCLILESSGALASSSWDFMLILMWDQNNVTRCCWRWICCVKSCCIPTTHEVPNRSVTHPKVVFTIYSLPIWQRVLVTLRIVSFSKICRKIWVIATTSITSDLVSFLANYW